MRHSFALAVGERRSTFASSLRALRDARGLTQRQVADLLGITTQTVCNWEAARSRPWNPAAVRERLADARAGSERLARPRVRVPMGRRVLENEP